MVKLEGQKVDDAEIPFAFWDKMFVEFLPPNFPLLCPSWRTALIHWRFLALVWWKRIVIHSFWADFRLCITFSQRASPQCKPWHLTPAPKT